MSATRIDIPNSIHKFKQFYTTLSDVYLKHFNQYDIEVIHDNKKVKAGIDKDTQKIGDINPYFNIKIFNPKHDIELNDDIFLLYDDAGVNYAHFFFDLFSKCFYFDEIRKQNPKLKLETKNLFYKNLEHRNAILYNDDEEIKIIQKLEYADKKNENDYLIDLEDLRKYAYVNFKHASRDHIKIRTPNTIEAIRYMNFKNKKNDLLETRIGHDNISLNVVGVVWNSSRFKMLKTPNLQLLAQKKIYQLRWSMILIKLLD
jgi:hypothetical protein